jgi:hypothetical protein
MKKLIICILLGLVSKGLLAHELMENRVTLVLHDKIHLSATFYIGYSEALHRALAPDQKYSEFLIKYSAINPREFQQELLRAQSRLQAATKMYAKDGAALLFSNWRWPDAVQVQKMIREQAMQAIINAASHAHEQPMEIRADVSSGQEIQSVSIQFPDEFQKVLVVSYRPSQVWVERKSKSPLINF